MNEYTFDASITVLAESQPAAADLILTHCITGADIAVSLFTEGTLNLNTGASCTQRNEILRLTRELDEARKLYEVTHSALFGATQRIDELEARLAWHKVSEKPPQGESPKYSVGVEVVYDGVLQLRTLANYSFMDSSWRDDHDCRLDGVTHWREIGELPAAPNEATGQDS